MPKNWLYHLLAASLVGAVLASQAPQAAAPRSAKTVYRNTQSEKGEPAQASARFHPTPPRFRRIASGVSQIPKGMIEWSETVKGEHAQDLREVRALVWRETVRAMRAGGRELELCPGAPGGPAYVRLRIFAQVENDVVEVGDWKLDQVLEGPALSDEYRSCLENSLGGAYRFTMPESTLLRWEGNLYATMRFGPGVWK